MDKKFLCSKCSKAFSHRQSKSKHQKLCGNVQHNTFDCDGCGFKSQRKDSLLRHKRTCKGWKKNHTCTTCSKEFNFKSDLVRHEVIHLKQGHHCNFCGKTFKRVDHFSTHICQNSTAVSCQFCDKKFAHKKSLKRHIKVCPSAPQNPLESSVFESSVEYCAQDVLLFSTDVFASGESSDPLPTMAIDFSMENVATFSTNPLPPVFSDSNRRVKVHRLASSLAEIITSTSLDDDSVVAAIVNVAEKFKLKDKLKAKLKVDKKSERTGRVTPLVTRQHVWDFWHSSSSVSTNTTRPATLKVTSKPKIQDDLPFNDSAILTKNNRNIDVYQNVWQITNKTFLELHQSFLRTYPKHNVSYGTFVALKPFYVRAASKKDQAMCLCKIHLHTQRAINTLIKLCDAQNIDLNFSDYSTFFNYLQANCSKPTNQATHLTWHCTPSKNVLCDHQKTIWAQLITYIKSRACSSVTRNFQFFTNKEVEVSKEGEVKNTTQLHVESKQVNLWFILDFIENILARIVHHRNLLANFRHVYPTLLHSFSTTEINMDFSENLTLSLPEEIQSMYWGQSKRQVTIHSGLVKHKGSKIYHPYFSDDRVHDQVFVYLSLKEMINDVEIEPESHIIITSDNCTSQYKSAKNFHDLQKISNEYNVFIIRVFGVASHGKNEVDTVGGTAKIAIRNAISRGKSFLNSEECVDYLSEKFKSNECPVYKFKTISKEILDEEREREKFIKYSTIEGSSTFQVMVFEPNSEFIRCSPYLCSCMVCMKNYGTCDNFTKHTLQANTMNKISLRSDELEAVTDNHDNSDMMSMIGDNSICAIVADNISTETVWFILVKQNYCCDKTRAVKDSYGHIIPKAQPYLRCSYFEKDCHRKDGILYKLSEKEVFVYKESIVYPLVEMKKLKDKYLLTNNAYVEVLNYIQYSGMGALF